MRQRTRGFSLIEVMIAVSILAGATVWLTLGVARSLRAENHARLTTTATFLARLKMNDVEDELLDKGFGEFDKQMSCGNFADIGFPRFSYCPYVDKVELPGATVIQSLITQLSDAQQTLAGGGGDKSSSSSSSGSATALAGGGMMETLYPMVKDALEQSIRRVTVAVTWTEGKNASTGAPLTRDVTIVTFLTDVRRIDQAIQLSLPTNLPGQPGAAGGSGGSNSAAGGTKK